MEIEKKVMDKKKNNCELLEQIKEYRNDMVARNYPHQRISDIITKWENRNVKTISEESQEQLEPITSPMSDE